MSLLKVSQVRIGRKVADLLEGQSAPPVDLSKVAEKLAVDVRTADLASDVSGVVYNDRDLRVVIVNQNQSKTRRRYAVAHELGRLAMHRVQTARVDETFAIDLRSQGAGTIDTIEGVEANHFAANLLIPTSWIERDLPGAVIDFSDEGILLTLAKRYEVGVPVMTYRLATLYLDR